MRQYARKSRFQGQGAFFIFSVMAGLLLWAFLSAQDKAKAGQLIKAAQGGQVRSPSGQAVLSIPAGALAADTKITIAELTAMEGPSLGPVYDLQPDGLKLLKPAAFTVKYSPQEVAQDFEPEDVVLVALTATAQTMPAADQQGQAGQPIVGWKFLETGVDASAGSARAQLTHLSKYSLRGCSSWRIGEKNKEMRGKFDYGLKFHQAEGSGSALANYQVKGGQLFAWAEVPRGTEGMAAAQSHMSKWFRVKPGKDGRRSTTNGRVAAKLKHKAKLSSETNQYLISLVVQCYDAQPVGMGTPRVLDDLQSMTQGRLMMTGLFQQNFFDDPQFGGKMTNFPLGPRYQDCYPLVVFENCKLEAGKYYAVTVGGTVGIIGQERDDAAGIPPKGGRVDWAQVLTYYFFISRIEVSSD